MTIADINTKVRSLCDADSTSYTAANLLIDVNTAVETLVGKIIQVCRNFTFDDENFANIAEGTITLEEGVSKYTLTDRFLSVIGWKVKDASGYWHDVNPYSTEEAKADGVVLETLEAGTGLPLTYRAIGRTFFFQPAPIAASCTLTAGGKFIYTRTSYQITSDDVTTGTLVPGIASPWHITIARMAAKEFCSTYKKDRVPKLMAEIQDDIYGPQGLLVFYANRQKDRTNRLTPRVENTH